MNTYFISMENAVIEQCPGHISYELLTEKNGCVNGCCCGISRYTTTEYAKPGCHADQEGFFVLSGSGSAKVGDCETEIYPGLSFVAPAGVPHAIRSNDEAVPVEVFWFHAAIF